MIGPVRAAVRDLDPQVAFSDIGMVDDTLFRWLRPQQVVTMLMGAIAVSIALLGVYGVVSYFVGLRRRAFGIRLALGARPRTITKLVVDYTVHVMLVGLLPGVLIASLMSRWIQSERLSVMPNDIPTWVVVPLLVLAAGVAAGWRPARRAARVDPVETLREH